MKFKNKLIILESDFQERKTFGEAFEEEIIQNIKKSQHFKEDNNTVKQIEKSNRDALYDNQGDICVTKADKEIYIEAKKSYFISLKSIFNFGQYENHSNNDFYFLIHIPNEKKYHIIKDNVNMKKKIYGLFNKFILPYNTKEDQKAATMKEIQMNTLDDFYKNFYKQNLKLDYEIKHKEEAKQYRKDFYKQHKQEINTFYNQEKTKSNVKFTIMSSGQFGINSEYFINLHKYKNSFEDLQTAIDFIIK